MSLFKSFVVLGLLLCSSNVSAITIYQLPSGEVFILGDDQDCELVTISAKTGDPDTLEFWVTRAVETPAGFNYDDVQYYYFSDVTDIFADLLGCTIDHHQSVRVNDSFYPWEPLTEIQGNLEIYSADPDRKVVINIVGDTVRQVRIDGDLIIETSAANDTFLLREATVAGNINIKTKGGSDRVIFLDAHVDGNTEILTGNGRDLFDARFVDFGSSLNVDTGRQGDEFIMASCSVDSSFSANLSVGNDEARIVHSDFWSSLVFNGGSGFDEISGHTNNFAKLMLIFGFEVNDLPN